LTDEQVERAAEFGLVQGAIVVSAIHATVSEM